MTVPLEFVIRPPLACPGKATWATPVMTSG